LITATVAERRRRRKLRRAGQWSEETDLDWGTEHFIDHESRQRRLVVYVPPRLKSDTPVALVLNFHGGMARADAQKRQSRMNEVADRHGFIVAYPDGIGRTPMLTFNAGYCCGYAARLKTDDVGFTRKMIEVLPQRYAIDPSRIYATGFSNGGMMCYRLACELSDKIAAIAPVSGPLGVDGPEPKRPVPIIHFHGLKDENARFEGGIGANQFQPVPHRSIPDTIHWWKRVNHCQDTPVAVENGPEYILERYEPAAGQSGAPIHLYKLPEGGHAWPGGADISQHLNTGRMIESVDASELIWQFFQRFQLPETT
jgi:polyhydroxybutyrate depolymerase